MPLILNGSTGITFNDATTSNSAIAITDSSWINRRMRFDFESSNGTNYAYDYAGQIINPLQNSATISTAQKKFGNSSLLCSGAASSALPQLPVQLLQPIGTIDFTIEMWVYPTSFTNNSFPGIIDLAINTGSRVAFYFNSATNGVFRINATSNNLTLSTVGISLNSWFHLCIERVSGTVTFYINGVSRSSGAFTTSIPTTWTMNIGSTTDGYPFAGYIDDFRFSMGTAVYNGEFSPPTTALPISPYNLSGVGIIGL